MASDDSYHINTFPSIGWQDPFPDLLPREEESVQEDDEEGEVHLALEPQASAAQAKVEEKKGKDDGSEESFRTATPLGDDGDPPIYDEL